MLPKPSYHIWKNDGWPPYDPSTECFPAIVLFLIFFNMLFFPRVFAVRWWQRARKSWRLRRDELDELSQRGGPLTRLGDHQADHPGSDKPLEIPLIPPKHIQACVAVSQRPSIAVMFLPWILLGFFGRSAGLCEQDHFTDLGHVMSLVHDHHTRHGGTELQMGSHFHKINIDL
jgi:hypothetical protein